jgi:hypothetical protein
MFPVFKANLESMQDNDLVWTYCATRTGTNEYVAALIKEGGDRLYEFLDKQTPIVECFRADVIMRLYPHPSQCAITLAYAMNISLPILEPNLKQTRRDLNALTWWPETFALLGQDLDAARANNIAAAWAERSEFDPIRFAGAVACRYPPAIYRLARQFAGTRVYYAALHLAMSLGNRDAIVDWDTEFDCWFRLASIDWHPRAKYALLKRSGMASIHELKEIVRAGCEDARMELGLLLLKNGNNDAAADWFGPQFFKWASHARIPPAEFSTIKITRAGISLNVVVRGKPTVRGLATARSHLRKARVVHVRAPKELHALMRENFAHIPEVTFE